MVWNCVWVASVRSKYGHAGIFYKNCFRILPCVKERKKTLFLPSVGFTECVLSSLLMSKEKILKNKEKWAYCLVHFIIFVGDPWVKLSFFKKRAQLANPMSLNNNTFCSSTEEIIREIILAHISIINRDGFGKWVLRFDLVLHYRRIWTVVRLLTLS